MYVVERWQTGVDIRVIKEARQCAIHVGDDLASQEDGA